MLEKYFLTSVWSPEHLKAGQNIQKWFHLVKKFMSQLQDIFTIFFLGQVAFIVGGWLK